MTKTFSNMKNMPQALKRQEEKLIEALRVSQPDRGDIRTRSVTKPEVSGWSNALSWFALIKKQLFSSLEGREQRKRCAEVSDHKQKCIEKQSYTVILSWAKPVIFPAVLVQNCLCVGLTCQWPQSPYCIWSHISNLDSQPLLASRSGSWTSHQIQRNLCHSLVYIIHDGHSSAIIAQLKAEDGICFRQTGISWLSQWVLQPLKLDRGGWEGISWHSKPLTSHSRTMEWWSDGWWV